MATANVDLIAQAQALQKSIFDLHRTLDAIPAPTDTGALKSAYDQIDAMLARWISAGPT